MKLTVYVPITVNVGVTRRGSIMGWAAPVLKSNGKSCPMGVVHVSDVHRALVKRAQRKARRKVQP